MVTILTQFDVRIVREQYILALDVSMDDLVLVEVTQTLHTTEEKKRRQTKKRDRIRGEREGQEHMSILLAVLSAGGHC